MPGPPFCMRTFCVGLVEWMGMRLVHRERQGCFACLNMLATVSSLHVCVNVAPSYRACEPALSHLGTDASKHALLKNF